MCVLYSALQHFNGFNTSTASTYSALQHFCTQSGRGAPEAAAEAQSLRQGAEGAAEAQGLAWADEAAMTRGAFLHFWESLGGFQSLLRPLGAFGFVLPTYFSPCPFNFWHGPFLMLASSFPFLAGSVLLLAGAVLLVAGTPLTTFGSGRSPTFG